MKKFRKKIVNKEIEKQLVPRLQYVGYSLVISGLLFLNYAIFLSPYPSSMPIIENFNERESVAGFSIVENSLPPEPLPKEYLNFYIVAGVFVAIGICCVLFAWRKRLTLFKNLKD